MFIISLLAFIHRTPIHRVSMYKIAYDFVFVNAGNKQISENTVGAQWWVVSVIVPFNRR
jgi:hypothetical protein